MCQKVRKIEPKKIFKVGKNNNSLTVNKTLNYLYPLIPVNDLVGYAQIFKEELSAALHKKKSSLSAILNPVHKIKPKPGFGVTAAIGITKEYVSAFRVSKNGVINFLNRRYFTIPTDLEKNDLFHLITQNILTITKMKKKTFPIGLSIAFPLNPIWRHKYLDGELMAMAKGKIIYNLIGKKVGEEYQRFLIEKYGIDTIVIVANDVICLLLGAEDENIAGVVDEGLNFAYWEKRNNIFSSFLSEYKKSEIAVNLESKNFNKIKITPISVAVDEASEDPGLSLAEKESAGAYLYRIFNAGKNEIIGDNFPRLEDSSQLNRILIKKFFYHNQITSKQQEKAYHFANRILHRSAQVVAIELSGILLKLKKNRGLVPVKMEGSVFWRFKNYPSLVNHYLNLILPDVIVSFSRIFGSSRRGIAILAKGR